MNLIRELRGPGAARSSGHGEEAWEHGPRRVSLRHMPTRWQLGAVAFARWLYQGVVYHLMEPTSWLLYCGRQGRRAGFEETCSGLLKDFYTH